MYFIFKLSGFLLIYKIKKLLIILRIITTDMFRSKTTEFADKLMLFQWAPVSERSFLKWIIKDEATTRDGVETNVSCL